MVKDDRIIMSFVFLIRNHNAKVIMTSNIFIIVNSLHINKNQEHLAKFITNKAHPRNNYFQLYYTRYKLTTIETIKCLEASTLLK